MGRCKGLVLFIGLFLSSASFAGLSKEQANRLLHDGAWKGYINRIKKALEAGADINSMSDRTDGKWTALSLAALGGNADCVEYLIKRGATVYKRHYCGATALHWAAYEVSSFERVAPLLLKGVVQEAKRFGLNPKEALADYINTTAYDFETALHWAAKRGDPGALIFLLEHPQTNINKQDHQGQTAVHHAIEGIQIHALRLLVLDNVDVNLCDKDGRSPLHYCAHRGWKKFAKIIIKSGADINKQDNRGQTALHEAAIQAEKRMYKYLLKEGADPSIRDKQGKTALDYIKEAKKLIDSFKKL